ncbi:MAG TPA: hypothetical protein VLN26_18630 [Gaiellaceae bacterium]|nr:hypothetical protein [Gaiellaceae bacterium]
MRAGLPRRPADAKVGAVDSWKRPYIAYFMFAAFLVVCNFVIR